MMDDYRCRIVCEMREQNTFQTNPIDDFLYVTKGQFELTLKIINIDTKNMQNF